MLDDKKKHKKSKDRNEESENDLHRKNQKRWVSAIPAVIIMITIFLFSCQNATQSGAESTHITERVLEFLQHFPVQIQEWAKNVDFEWLEFLIRKLAHGTEYAILGIALCFHFSDQTKDKTKTIFWKTVLAGACYAGTDEFHQLFVPGRSGQIRDVCIDTVGVIVGTAIFLMIRKHRRTKREKMGQ